MASDAPTDAAAGAVAADDASPETKTAAAVTAAKARRLPFGWKVKVDATGEPFFQSSAGRAEYDLSAELLPVFAMPSIEEGGTAVVSWVRYVCVAADKNSVYFYHSHTGEITSDVPALYYKQQKEKKAKGDLPMPGFQIAAIKMQCAWRQKHARARTNWIRATNHQRFAGSHARYIKTFHPHFHQYYWCDPKARAVSWDQPQPEDEYNFATEGDTSRFPEWFRLWDPSHKQHYYYHTFEGNWQYTKPINYNAAMWAFGQRSGFPPVLRGTLAIQTMYRARTVRDKIIKEREVREKMTAEERAKYMDKRALVLAEKKRAMIARRESEREANENAILAHEEAMQRVRGDKFWGLDIAEQAKQHRIKVERMQREKAAADKKKQEDQEKEAAARRARMKNSRRTDMKRETIEQEDMTREEAQQRGYYDAFWGVDKEERDRKQGLDDMAAQDAESARREARDKLRAMHGSWGEELEQARAQEKLNEASAQLDRRAGYMDMFFDSLASNEVIEYVWPGSRRAAAAGHSLAAMDSLLSVQQQQDGAQKVSGFGLDNIYSKRRLNAPASIYHDLNPLRSAPPRAARDFLVREHEGAGFLLLPHLWECREEEMSTGAVPPEMVQRMLDSRQTTASRSLLSPSRAEAKRLRERERRLADRRRPEVSEGRSDDGGVGNESGSRSGSWSGSGSGSESGSGGEYAEKYDEGNTTDGGGSAIVLDADVRGVLRRSGQRKAARKSMRQRATRVNGARRKKRGRKATRAGRVRSKGAASVTSGRGGGSMNPDASASSPLPPPPPPPPPMEVVIHLSEEQKARLKVIFELMDSDNSGMVDQHEMMIALRTNKKVIEFVTTSKLLAPLLLDAEFARTFMAMDPNSDGGVSYDEFVEFMQENSSEEAVIEDMKALAEEEAAAASGGARGKTRRTSEGYESKAVTILGATTENNPRQRGEGGGGGAAAAAATIESKMSAASTTGVGSIEKLLRRVFKMLDTNGTGTMGRREFLFALKGLPDLRDFVAKSPPLPSLVKHKKFLDALQQLPDPMRQSDFVEMGSEIAMQLEELRVEQEGIPDPLSEKEVDELRVIITASFAGKREVTKSKLTRLLLSTKVSGKLLAASHDALAPLLKPRTFKKTLAALDTDKDDAISVGEVLAFCTSYVGTV
jgi:Ca2+-binding EF-hand superfamily protein